MSTDQAILNMLGWRQRNPRELVRSMPLSNIGVNNPAADTVLLSTKTSEIIVWSQ